ncbi:glycine cleavage system protein GcvH [Haloplanus rallus]|jgi:glycine cleavage system H protein|uniref:Probable glycine cleavage system H protein n=1 Tax=Haloplanus rallus TaxID=1816183 RepID=A0A6B9FFW3_9EURY|nr:MULTISPECIES: glycine cleavage system protein GcvH [Haloplanus]QGX96230.1 glycine cleavage system protein GcvH [Haloplanus rallus]
MSFDVPTDRRYLESHEWTTTDGDTVRIGITDFAQDELGDVVFVELPDVGSEVTAEAEFGVVESIKAVSDLLSPVSGTVTAVNEDLFDAPELLNQDPYGDGWMLEVEPSDESEFDDLLTADEYRDNVE